MSIYKPTFLYIKQHTVTGKLYFGKTTKNPESYAGSGKYWLAHINKHGKNHVETLWYCLFYDKDDCVSFAQHFSKQHDIVNSDDWANLMVENGLNGGLVKNNYFKIYNTIPRTEAQKYNRSVQQQGKASKTYPVIINNIEYPSITAAGRAFNLTDAAIHHWIKLGKATRKEREFRSPRYSCISCRKELSTKTSHSCVL